jgi:hypothetical protein
MFMLMPRRLYRFHSRLESMLIRFVARPGALNGKGRSGLGATAIVVLRGFCHWRRRERRGLDSESRVT